MRGAHTFNGQEPSRWQQLQLNWIWMVMVRDMQGEKLVRAECRARCTAVEPQPGLGTSGNEWQRHHPPPVAGTVDRLVLPQCQTIVAESNGFVEECYTWVPYRVKGLCRPCLKRPQVRCLKALLRAAGKQGNRSGFVH